jgi:DNA invertase Pin-like site-specific DNA recombinase
MKPAVAYLRVSTRMQGESGLGIDAQRAAVERFCRQSEHELIDEFLEIESGRVSSRPVLREAIDRAKGTNSLLVIARLDRLSRSCRFIAELLESNLRFVACDVPSANRLILQILAAVAEEEAKANSIRTKAAMAAAKARGVVFGSPQNLTLAAAVRGGKASTIARRRKRDEHMTPTLERRMRELRARGFGFKQIAAVLNAERYETSHGNRWRPGGVWEALRRLAG